MEESSKQLKIIVAVECPQLWNNKLRKLRIYHLIPTENKKGEQVHNNTYTGRCLHRDIIQYVQSEVQSHDGDYDDDHTNPKIIEKERDYNFKSDSSSSIEIYNPDESQFESITGQNVIDCDIVKKYGTRCRCILNLETKKITNADNDDLIPKIMGRYFSYDPDGMDYADQVLIIKEYVNSQIDGTGLNVWDGALLLALYLERSPCKIQSKSVLELGAGTGLVGIGAGILGAKEVILTDLEYTMTLMKSNIHLNRDAIMRESNSCVHIDCYVCDWFNPPTIASFQISSSIIHNDVSYPEVILVADCVWLEELVNPLMDTIEQYCNNEATVIITYQQRGKSAHELFWKRLEGIFTHITFIDSEVEINLKKPETISLIECRK
mmetsp:Transcript_1350/g.1819  ORF Transcript_1350/g.1819 Transcript_1350/m.1819 type:complete len:379 (+) Transcript_1350:27-1163(+)